MQSAKASKNLYNTPQLNRLAFEQAAVFLVGHAYNNGDREAHTLLDVMFPDLSQTQSQTMLEEKKGSSL